MKKITLDREQLYDKISKLIAFVPDKTVIPAHENFLFKTEGDFITITSSDSTIQASVKFKSKIKEHVSFCVPAGLLVKTVGLFRENDLHITQKDNFVELRSGKSKYKITLSAKPEDFPIIKTEGATSEISVSQKTLKKALKTVGKFTSDDTSTPSLMGINITCVNNKVVFTGAQRSHMARIELKPISIGRWDPFLFSSDFYSKISGIMDDKGEVAIAHNGDRIMMFTDQEADESFMIKFLSMSAKYPDSEKLFNSRPQNHFTANTLEFKDCIKRLSLYSSKDEAPSFTMSREGNDIKLVSIDMNTAKEGEEFISGLAWVDENGIDKTLNCKFMSEILSCIEEDEVNMYFSESQNIPSFITPRVMEEDNLSMCFLIQGINKPTIK